MDGEPILKRAIGLGGDVVEVRDGILFVNGTAVKEPYLDRNSIEGLYYGPVTVGEDSVLVLGNARAKAGLGRGVTSQGTSTRVRSSALTSLCRSSRPADR